MKEIRSSGSIAFIGMLGALSAVLMLISVPLPFAPGFLKFDIAELPALFAGFFLGPVGGCAVIIVKILLKLVTQGTDTAFVGDLMNIAGSCTFVLPAAFMYMLYCFRMDIEQNQEAYLNASRASTSHLSFREDGGAARGV